MNDTTGAGPNYILVGIGTQYWKYGPTAGNTSPHWYTMPATIVGNTITLSITDGGLGDDDLAVNGAIVDAGGPAALAVTQVIPATDSKGLMFLALLLAILGGATLRRTSRR